MRNAINQNVYLFIGLIAVLIQVVSYGLFEINAESSLRIKTIILTTLEKQPITPFDNINAYRSRLLWQGSCLLSITAYIIALVWSGVIIYRCRQRAYLYKIICFGVLVATFNLWYILNADAHNAMYNNIFSTTFEALQTSLLLDKAALGKIFILIAIINILAAITPVVILMAICSLIILPAVNIEYNQTFFIERLAYLEQGIIVGSMIMLFGIVHMAAWTQWPIAMLNNLNLKKAILAAFSAIYLYWGVAFSILLFSLYSCVVMYLRSQVREVLHYAQPAIDVNQWLQENRFSLSWHKHIPQLSAMLTPLLAGLLSGSGINLLSTH